MKWSRLLELGAQAHADAEVVIGSPGGTVDREGPSKLYEDQTRDHGGHASFEGATASIADVVVLIDGDTGARGNIVIISA